MGYDRLIGGYSGFLDYKLDTESYPITFLSCISNENLNMLLPILIITFLIQLSYQLALANDRENGGYPIEPAARTTRFDPYSNVTPLTIQSDTASSVNSTSTSTTMSKPPSSSTSKGDASGLTVPLFAYLVYLML